MLRVVPQVAACVWSMVRFPVIFFCCFLIPSAVFAFPKIRIGEGPSLAIRVQDSEDFPHLRPQNPASSSSQRLTPADCRRYSAEDSPAACLEYRRRLAAQIRERQAALARAKAARAQAAAIKQASKKAVSNPLSEHERNAEAPKPLVTPRAAAPLKAVPGKTPEERLRHMVGQLVLTGFSGRQPEDADVERIARELREGKVSGVIVRDSNIANAQQLRRLIAAFGNTGGDNPALIAIEQPGGPDTVLSEEKGFAFYSSANAVSGAGSPYEAQLLYRAMASELAGLGVTLNIGPSEDVCRENGVNLSAVCFGTSPSRIAAFARGFNFGHHDRGVLTALRHVPFRTGLRTSWISESASSAILHRLVQGETSDALVVRVKAMQPLHLTDVSFGLSRKARARGERSFGFHGALIFEVEMGSAGAPMRYGDAIVRAFEAGADMILLREPNSMPGGIPAVSLEAIQAGVKSGRLQMSRIEDAYRHVQRLKARLRTFPSRTKIAGLDR